MGQPMKLPSAVRLIIGLLVFSIVLNLFLSAVLIGSMQQLYLAINTLTEFNAKNIMNVPVNPVEEKKRQAVQHQQKP
jgi:hypothetical protein